MPRGCRAGCCNTILYTAVSEIVKSNFSVGERSGLYFWRDNHRKEIDDVLESGLKQSGIEINSGQTVRSYAFAGLTYWKTLAREDTPETYLVYAGDESYTRGGTHVVGWRSAYEELVQRAL